MNEGVVGSFRARPVGVKDKGWGARLMIAPLVKGKKWAAAMVLWPGPVRVMVPSGVMVAGKGEEMMAADDGKRAAWALGPPVRGSLKWACSGMQISLQMSQFASASIVVPVICWAVKGRTTSPERT